MAVCGDPQTSPFLEGDPERARTARSCAAAAFVEPGEAGDATRERLEAWRREALAWQPGHGSSEPA